MSEASSDAFDLQRFVRAQEEDYEQALAELRAGFKRSHWIWYVLPQLKGLGQSEFSEYYGISGLPEASAYLAHDVLGSRLKECIEVMDSLQDTSAEQVLGEIDAMKFRSCLTLFAQVAPDSSLFIEALRRYFHGRQDDRTIQSLREQPCGDA